MPGVRCMVMRGGSSKGAYFVADDLPHDVTERDRLLLSIMGSPDARQIDGIGGAHPLTSKVAVVSRALDEDADLNYLFLQVGVDEPLVSDQQNCGNLLAGVGPFALERGLLSNPGTGVVQARVRMLNTDAIATASFEVTDGAPVYEGTTAISGVPGSAAPIRLDFEDIAGGSTGSLLPTGNSRDLIDGIECTLVDNGMPVVVMRAEDFGVRGDESCEELEANPELRRRLERVRLEAGSSMGLGDVAEATIPKLTLVSPPRDAGDLCTRTFIPHRCHDAIGVLGAVSVATAALMPDAPAHEHLRAGVDGRIVLEHPTGSFEAAIDMSWEGGLPVVERAGIIRTARKLMDGVVFPHQELS